MLDIDIDGHPGVGATAGAVSPGERDLESLAHAHDGEQQHLVDVEEIRDAAHAYGFGDTIAGYAGLAQRLGDRSAGDHIDGERVVERPAQGAGQSLQLRVIGIHAQGYDNGHARRVIGMGNTD